MFPLSCDSIHNHPKEYIKEMLEDIVRLQWISLCVSHVQETVQTKGKCFTILNENQKVFVIYFSKRTNKPQIHGRREKGRDWKRERGRNKRICWYP